MPKNRRIALGRIARAIHGTALVMAAGSCGGDATGPSGPPENPLTAYAGSYAGKTSQNRNINLWVNGSGTIDSMRVLVSVSMPLGSCIVTYRPKAISISQDRGFDIALDAGTFVTGKIVGKFDSQFSAKGTFWAAWRGIILCGNTLTVGNGSDSVSGTWNVAKS